jgi:hypothetical protein
MTFRKKFVFYDEGLLAPRLTPKLEDNPLSFVRGCLFNIFLPPTTTGGRPFHQQPEDAPCRGDNGTHLTWQSVTTYPLRVAQSVRQLDCVYKPGDAPCCGDKGTHLTWQSVTTCPLRVAQSVRQLDCVYKPGDAPCRGDNGTHLTWNVNNTGIYKSSSYLTGDTSRLHYTAQSVNAV